MGLGKWLKASLTGRRREIAAENARREAGSANTQNIVQEMFGRRRSPVRADRIERRETIPSD